MVAQKDSITFRSELSKLKEVANSNIVLTLFLTGLGYGIAYSFQAGQMNYLRLPWYLIEISTPALIFSIGITLLLGFSVVIYAISYWRFEQRNKDSKWLKYLARLLVIVFIGSFVLLAFDLFYWRIILAIIAIIFLISAIIFLFYVIKKNGVKKAWGVVKGLSEDRAQNSPFNNIPLRLNLFYIIGVSVLMFSFIAGGLGARTPTTYSDLVLGKEGDVIEVGVIVRGDDVYVKKYDTKNRKYLDGFIITKLQYDKEFMPYIANPETGTIDNFFRQ